MMKQEHRVLFEPNKIGPMELKNRYSMAPMGTLGLVDGDGAYNKRGIDYYVARAKGGVGLIITGIHMAENELEPLPMPSLPCPTLNPTAYLRSAKEMCERVHSHGAKIIGQITAGWGRSMIPGFTPPGKAVAPSECPNRFDPSIIHRELTTEEVQYYIRQFIQTAAIMKKAGFDGVEVHAVHEGYLLDQFTLEFFNKRTDQYGGSFENRYRFAVEIIKGIRHVCGDDFAITLRYSVKSNTKGFGQGILPGEEAKEVGRDLDEGLKAAKYLVEAGCDALNVDAGTYDAWYWNHPPNYFKPGMYKPYCKAVAEVVDVPVIMAGRMDEPNMASRAVNEGVAQNISLGRPLLADPEIVNKIRRGRPEEVRPCLSCHLGCLGRMAEVGNVSCAVNPQCGREEEYKPEPLYKKQKLVVIGGGVGGMEAARTAADRGHEVVLFEKSDRLGGNVIPGSQAPFKHDDATLLSWYEGEMKRKNVDVRMNTAANVDVINAEKPDTVIFATGSRPVVPQSIKGIDKSHVIIAEDMLMHPEKITGQNVTVIGAGLVGAEAALWMAQEGKTVTLVDAADDIIGGPHGTCFANYLMMKELLVKEKVTVKTSTFLSQITDSGVELHPADKADEIEAIAADHVIVAIGYRAENDMFKELETNLDVENIYNIGDSKQARTIMTAIWDAYEVTRSL
ncbi:FAD-dependent oxidoreductase [Vibrio kyushuensis]|uniref:oxidoreductase n=1 Tax=Vibrio kyushuensis TaxID=2910249 RepID=UPI003D09B830